MLHPATRSHTQRHEVLETTQAHKHNYTLSKICRTLPATGSLRFITYAATCSQRPGTHTHIHTHHTHTHKHTHTYTHITHTYTYTRTHIHTTYTYTRTQRLMAPTPRDHSRLQHTSDLLGYEKRYAAQTTFFFLSYRASTTRHSKGHCTLSHRQHRHCFRHGNRKYKITRLVARTSVRR